MKTNGKPKSRHKITFMDDVDLEVLVRGALGQSTRAIQEHTKLTACQICYRLKKGEIKRSDYRNGTSRFAQSAYDACAHGIHDKLKRELPRRFT